MVDETIWNNFFKENPEPAGFEENVQRIRTFCSSSIGKDDKVALLTVKFTGCNCINLKSVSTFFYLLTVWWNYCSSRTKYSALH